MASKRRLRRKSCTNKIAYPTKEAAIAARRRGLETYKCRFGSHWHNGHHPARAKAVAEIRRREE